MTPIRLLQEAEEELRIAAQYYEEAQPGLGRALIAEVRRAKEFIAQHPLAARIERGDIRVRSISRFPYSHRKVGRRLCAGNETFPSDAKSGRIVNS